MGNGWCGCSWETPHPHPKPHHKKQIFFTKASICEIVVSGYEQQFANGTNISNLKKKKKDILTKEHALYSWMF